MKSYAFSVFRGIVNKLKWLVLSEEQILMQRVIDTGVKRVCVYGANSLCARMICLLECHGISVEAVVDRKAMKESFSIQSIPVQAKLPEDTALVVICVMASEKEVYKSLSQQVKSISINFG